MRTGLAIDLGLTRLRECRHGVMLFMPHDAYVGRSLDLYGEFSEHEVELIRQLLKPGACAVDIGANVGALTVPMARLVGDAGRVIAIEPQPMLACILSANVALNALTNVRVEASALGRASGVASIPRLSYRTAGNYGAVPATQTDGTAASARGERVALRRLDDLQLERCDVVKIDVEGNELDVLAGAAQTLRRHRPALYIENDREEKSAALLAHLLGLDYRLYWHMPPLFNARNFRDHAEDVFRGILSINVLAVPRERAGAIDGLEPVLGADDSWKAARAREVRRKTAPA